MRPETEAAYSKSDPTCRGASAGPQYPGPSIRAAPLVVIESIPFGNLDIAVDIGAEKQAKPNQYCHHGRTAIGNQR